MLRTLGLLSLLMLLRQALPAQDKIADSLLNILKTAAEDTGRVNTLNSLSLQLLTSNGFSASLEYASQASKLSGKIGFKKGAMLAYKTMGTAQYRLGHYPEALENYFACLKLAEALGDKKGMANCYNNIGSVYDYQGNYTETNKYYAMALQIRKQLGDARGLAMSYNNIGIAYINQGEPDKALMNLQDALAILLELDDKSSIASCYANMSAIYADKGNYNESLKNDMAALKIREELQDQEGMAMSWLNIAGTYERIKNYSMAENYCLKGLAVARELEYLELIRLANQTLSDIYMNTGKHAEALKYYKAAVVAKDSLFNEENTKRSVRLEMNYEFEKKEAVREAEREKKEVLAESERRKQRIILQAISGCGLLILCFAIFAWRSFLQKRKANEAITRQKEIIEEKQKEILDSIKYARRIQHSLLTNEKYIAGNLARLTGRS